MSRIRPLTAKELAEDYVSFGEDKEEVIRPDMDDFDEI